MSFSWTVERENTLRRMWLDGSTGYEIMAEIGAPTRNVVMGKINRLGFHRCSAGSDAERKARAKPRAKRRQPFRPVVAKASEPVVEAVPIVEAPKVEPIAVGQPVTLMDLDRWHCRYPVGDPASPDFQFCGGPRIADSSYCNAHHLLCYTTPPKKTTLSQEERARRQRMERTGSARAFG